jgi:hypothetical protein
MRIRKIREMLQNVRDTQDALLLPGESMVLAALITQLQAYGDDITPETLKGIQAGVQIVWRVVGCTEEYSDLIDGLQYVDNAFQTWIDEKQPEPTVTITARITVPVGYAKCIGILDISDLLHGISDEQINGDVEITIEEGSNDGS